MIKLYDNGVYLLNGKELVEDKAGVQAPISKRRSGEKYDGIQYFECAQYIGKYGESADQI